MAWFVLGLSVYFLVLLSERVLVGIAPHEVEQLRGNSSGHARRSIRLVEQVRHALSALLLARVFLKIVLAVTLTTALAQSPLVRQTLYDWSQAARLPGLLIWSVAAAILAGVLSLLFWGLKQVRWPDLDGARARAGLRWLGPFILVWHRLFAPFLPKPENGNSSIGSYDASETHANAQSGSPEKQRELELLKSIVKFSDVTVKQVMQPRSKVIAVDFRTGFADLLGIVREAGFSRMPVYDEDLDNVTGILYVKDLVTHLGKPDDFEWQSLIRTNFLLVPEAKRVSELLQEFKRNRRHMAIVVDEYGGSSGIVTLEDILEEITGEIQDEFDEESEIHYRKLDDHNFLFEGQTLLNDACRIAGLAPGAFDDVRGAADTLAGLVLELKGDIPVPGAEIRWNSYLITVVAADNRKIEQVKLTIGLEG